MHVVFMSARLSTWSSTSGTGAKRLGFPKHINPGEYRTCARFVRRLTIWVPEKQAALPWSVLPSSRRGGRSRAAHSANLAGNPGNQVINSGEEYFQNRGCVRFVISDH